MKINFLFNLLCRHSSWAPVVYIELRPPPALTFQRNKHNMQRGRSSFLKRHRLVSSCKFCSKAAVTKDSGPTHAQDHGGPQTPAIKHPTTAESFHHCVLYEQKGSQRSAVTDAVTLHIAKDMLLVYTVEKPGGSSTCWKCRTPGLCYGAAVAPRARGSRQARLPGQKCVKKTSSTHLMSCTSTTCLVYDAMHADV